MQRVNFNSTLFSKFPCSRGNPLNCPLNFPQLKSQSKEESPEDSCKICHFPALVPEKTKIKGKEGNYLLDRTIGYRGLGRLYQGTCLIDQQAVIIKEYLFPDKCFEKSDIKRRPDNLQKFSNLQLIDGRKPDFRLLLPKETIIERQAQRSYQRCYSIFNVAVSALSLRGYLEKNDSIEEEIVWQILDQVLQSLSLLHRQKFRLSFGVVKSGIAHGNLSLDTLLISFDHQSFLIYLADLALWERFADPLSTKNLNEICTDTARLEDLKNLGYIGFYLLAGTTVDDEGKPLDPYQDKNWKDCSQVLKTYLFNLMGKGILSLKTAEIARQELLKVRPKISPSKVSHSLLPLSSSTTSNHRRWWWIGGGILGLILLVLLLYWLSIKIRVSQFNLMGFARGKIANIADTSSGTFYYGAIQGSSWDYVYTQKNLTKFRENLEETIENSFPNLKQWTYISLGGNQSDFKFLVTTPIRITKKREIDRINFMIGSPDSPLSTQYKTSPFAYDAIAVFVAFNYAKRQNGLPYALKGQITLKQLQKIYTGQVKHWDELNRHFPPLPIQLYVPTDPEIEAIFKARVLQTEDMKKKYEFLVAKAKEDNPETTDTMLKNQACSQKSEDIRPIYRRSTYGEEGILQCIIKDFEDNDDPIGSIGFDSLSKIVSQCSVYPLAISTEGKDAISPLILDREQGITPETNLCNHKGSYGVNTKAVRSQKYPLTYPLSVIYYRDNRRNLVGDQFADVLKTRKGQCLLKIVQLTPIFEITSCKDSDTF
ncbi:MAG: substrate-binding domain-containing protein [Crocosphaera sp.]|nr:substrate-binding domain-containing protein [Crocosphaera sp.]